MESPQFSLRPATPDDLPKVLEIENRVHVAPWKQPHFEAEIEKPYSHFLVLSDDETDQILAGYVIYWQMGSGEGDAEILNIAVDLPFRGKGLARQMLRQIISMAVREGRKRVILDVRKSNIAAIQLYQSLRFSITQVRKGFYSNGEDAYGMTLFLDEISAPADFLE